MLKIFNCVKLIGLMIVFILPCIGYSETQYADPMTTCLNDYVLPKLSADILPEKLVDNAFITCKSQVDEWLKPFEAIDKREENYKSMHDFYVRMVNIRRKAELNNN
ncbi:hypothetical protein [Photorhabdus heterorhabditis]|uniref:hypothetical protein n=1 Tax=Photorhabdus heterorhabditis TaxID=880156 RepID=UPI001561C6B1|nr:hypothetical protein [Photorhabdus heterorhabditis]NRN30001.1 hypothetical protein [Photorhabdus heterorhabditis subsp. aluminescens]